MDIPGASDKFSVFIMKRDTTNTIMIFVLGALAILGVWFALRGIFGQRELRGLQIQAAVDNSYQLTVEAIATDALAYSQQHPNPDIQRILQSAGIKAQAPK
jgi:hypothetical protein